MQGFFFSKCRTYLDKSLKTEQKFVVVLVYGRKRERENPLVSRHHIRSLSYLMIYREIRFPL